VNANAKVATAAKKNIPLLLIVLSFVACPADPGTKIIVLSNIDNTTHVVGADALDSPISAYQQDQVIWRTHIFHSPLPLVHHEFNSGEKGLQGLFEDFRTFWEFFIVRSNIHHVDQLAGRFS
tara:strand:- start:361 stop:726 length:366 start_codon:yes stop_codon:yes gene_type:complete